MIYAEILPKLDEARNQNTYASNQLLVAEHEYGIFKSPLPVVVVVSAVGEEETSIEGSQKVRREQSAPVSHK